MKYKFNLYHGPMDEREPYWWIQLEWDLYEQFGDPKPEPFEDTIDVAPGALHMDLSECYSLRWS